MSRPRPPRRHADWDDVQRRAAGRAEQRSRRTERPNLLELEEILLSATRNMAVRYRTDREALSHAD
ncbi:hypothetical protein [Nocardia sp. NPDC052566]|uniref:hypothetical protein n=1 Tax=Nocardia sp. NPDC052566 TaxID=3364330 RepID=UPI0037CB568F